MESCIFILGGSCDLVTTQNGAYNPLIGITCVRPVWETTRRVLSPVPRASKPELVRIPFLGGLHGLAGNPII